MDKPTLSEEEIAALIKSYMAVQFVAACLSAGDLPDRAISVGLEATKKLFQKLDSGELKF